MGDETSKRVSSRRAGGSGWTRRRLMRGLGMLGVGAAGVAVAMPNGNAYYNGPVSDHFDGERFFNPGAKGPAGFRSFLKWQFGSRAEKWPDTFPSPHAPFRPGEPFASNAVVTAIGHASFLYQTEDCNILIDPVYADRASPVSFAGPKRVNAPGIAFDDLPKIHAVIVTHNHYDHMDTATLKRLWQRDNPRFITPLGNDTILKNDIGAINAVALDWDQGTVIPRGPRYPHPVTVTAVPTQHWSARGTRDRMYALWASFIISNGARTVYAVGDSGFGDGRTFRHVRSQHPKIHMALLPIGAYEPRWFMSTQHMNPEEAVAAFKLCGAEQALGHHWGTFQLTNEAIDAPPKALAAALAGASLAPDVFVPIQPGQTAFAGMQRIRSGF